MRAGTFGKGAQQQRTAVNKGMRVGMFRKGHEHSCGVWVALHAPCKIPEADYSAVEVKKYLREETAPYHLVHLLLYK